MQERATGTRNYGNRGDEGDVFNCLHQIIREREERISGESEREGERARGT